jgi:predicted HicB family RNase H-like nuclease
MSEAQDRTKIINLRLSPDEHRRFSAAAKRRGLALGAWLRMLALDATAPQTSTASHPTGT